MDYNDYLIALLVHERIAASREAAARRALVRCAPRRPLRGELGVAFVALGQWLLTPAPACRRDPA